MIKKPKLIIFPCYLSPIFKVKGVIYVTVIHDLCSFKSGYMKKNIARIHRFGIKNAIKNADTIIVVSETTKKDLINMFNISPDKIKIVYNSIPQHFYNKNLDCKPLNFNLIPKGYILSVATLNINKNIPCISFTIYFYFSYFSIRKILIIIFIHINCIS